MITKFIEWIKFFFYKEPIETIPHIVESRKDYYNNKYPKSNIFYNRKELDGEYKIDVRLFLNKNNCLLPIIDEGDDDEKALQGLKWVLQNITYTSDTSEYKNNEYWAYGYQTLKHKKGDCEDGAILLYDILRNAGIPAWKLRLSAGWVMLANKKVGHAYLTYYCEDTEKWVILDWCYWENTVAIKDRKEYKKEINYKETWFSFNEDYSWTKGLNNQAKELLE